MRLVWLGLLVATLGCGRSGYNALADPDAGPGDAPDARIADDGAILADDGGALAIDAGPNDIDAGCLIAGTNTAPATACFGSL